MVREDIVQITEQFLAELKVGHYCCSQFSVDQCWYRGRVIDINREHENGKSIKLFHTVHACIL